MKLKKYNILLIVMFFVTVVLGVTAVFIGFRLRNRETVTPEESQAKQIPIEGGIIYHICGVDCVYPEGDLPSFDWGNRGNPISCTDGPGKCDATHCYVDNCSTPPGKTYVQVNKCLSENDLINQKCECQKVSDYKCSTTYSSEFSGNDPDDGIPNACYAIQLDVVINGSTKDWVVWKGALFNLGRDECIPQDVCGNGEVEGDEECDPPGNTSQCQNGAVCGEDCTCPLCGNGIIDEGEECDPPNDPGGCDGHGCSADCTCPEIQPDCGNELCDQDGETCEYLDGIWGYVCSNGNNNQPPGGSQVSCRQDLCNYCGDGNIDSGEECEIGETCNNGQACTSSCDCPSPPALPECTDLQHNQGGTYNSDPIDLIKGQALTLSLQTSVENESQVTGYQYGTDQGYGIVSSTGAKNATWGITQAQSALLTTGNHASVIYVTVNYDGGTSGGDGSECSLGVNVTQPELQCLSMTAQNSSGRSVFIATFSPANLQIDKNRIDIGFYAQGDSTKTPPAGYDGAVESVSCDAASRCTITWKHPTNMVGNNIAQIKIDGEFPDTACAVTFSGPPPASPLFTLTKGSTQVCVDNSTQAVITYSIVVSNTGGAAGDIESVTDTLDSKMQSSWVSQISSGGTLSGNVITWTGFTLAAGTSRTFTYIVTVLTGQIGSDIQLKNVVLARPVTGNDISYTYVTAVSCLPGVGVVDRSFLTILFGVLVFLLGLLGIRTGVIEIVKKRREE